MDIPTSKAKEPEVIGKILNPAKAVPMVLRNSDVHIRFTSTETMRSSH